MISPEGLNSLYATTQDPWDYTTSWYELRKRQITVACLPEERYRRCYEPGCSIGELTKVLAPRCAELLATDGAATAVQLAREATQGLGHVRDEHAVLPQELPGGSFDLIVLSELLYFFPDEHLPGLVDVIAGRLASDGDLVAVHCNAMESCAGAGVHRFLFAHPRLVPLTHHQDEGFALDVFRRAQG